MYCKKCKEEIDNPLMLYTGSIVCPKCKKNLINCKHKETAEGKMFFKLGEEAFYKGIIEASKQTISSSRNNKYRDYLQKAYKLFEESMRREYLYANYYLGFFFDRDYVGLNMNESLRCRIAYKFYTSVLDYSDSEIALSKEMLDKCAFNFLKMLHAWKEGEKIATNYSYKENYEKYKSLLVDDSLKKLSELDADMEAGQSEDLALNIIHDINDRRMAPILAIIKCDKSTIKKILNDKTINLLRNVKIGMAYIGDETSIKYLKQDTIFRDDIESNLKKDIDDGYFIAIVQTKYFGANINREWPRVDNIIKNRKGEFTSILMFEDDLEYTENVAKLTEFAYKGDEY